MTLFLALVALIVLLGFIYYKETFEKEIDESFLLFVKSAIII